MDRQSLLDQTLSQFGGQNANPGQQIAFKQVATDLGYNPTDIALELSKQQSADAINSSLGISSGNSGGDSSIHSNISSLKGFPITQAFGNKNGVEVFSHGVNTGADIGTPENTPVFLPKGKWKVLNAYSGAKGGYVGDSENSGYGNSVYLQNLDTGEKLRFSHLNSVNVPSDTMQGGEAVGMTGATGNVTGPHLDVEYHNPAGQLSDFLTSPYAQQLGLGGNK